MIFKDIPGLEDKKAQLIRAVQNNKVAHAQLFSGKDGCPNLAMAIAYATYLNCENPTETDACGICPACSKNMKLVHPDVHYIFPLSSTKNVKSEEAISERFLPSWREFVIKHPFGNLDQWSAIYGGEDKQVNISKRESREIIKMLSLKAFEGKYKIMIIWLSEHMHQSAANGILKILEEPPEQTVFLLVTNNFDRLLTTITSRTQIVRIPKIDDKDIVKILIENHGLSSDKAALLAPLADGNLETALQLSQQQEDDSHDFFAQWMRSCFRKELGALVKFADDFHKLNKLAQRNILNYGLTIFRESLIYRHSPSINKVSGPVLAFTEKFSSALTEDKIAFFSQQIDEAYYHLERNGSPKIVFLDLSLQIAAKIK